MTFSKRVTFSEEITFFEYEPEAPIGYLEEIEETALHCLSSLSSPPKEVVFLRKIQDELDSFPPHEYSREDLINFYQHVKRGADRLERKITVLFSEDSPIFNELSEDYKRLARDREFRKMLLNAVEGYTLFIRGLEILAAKRERLTELENRLNLLDISIQKLDQLLYEGEQERSFISEELQTRLNKRPTRTLKRMVEGIAYEQRLERMFLAGQYKSLSEVTPVFKNA